MSRILIVDDSGMLSDAVIAQLLQQVDIVVIGCDPGTPIGGVSVSWSEVDGVIVSRAIPAAEMYQQPDERYMLVNQECFDIIELAGRALYKPPQIPVTPRGKQKAQWKRERSGRR